MNKPNNTFIAAGLADAYNVLIGPWEKYTKDYDWKGEPVNPFKTALFTPSSFKKSTARLDLMKELKEKGTLETLIFDSGGFQIWNQTSKYTFDELLEVNVRLYTENDWADYFILQDYPPGAEDSDAEVDEKIEKTIESSFKLFNRLPDHVKKKCLPVFHAKYLHQIEYQVERYAPLFEYNEEKLISFSNNIFGRKLNTDGKKLDLDGLLILNKIKDLDLKVHFLGMGSTLFLFLLKCLGMNFQSFDNTTWVREAAYGRILFPYIASCQVTDADNRRFKVGTNEELERAKEMTGHSCPFCQNTDILKTGSYHHRALHNLIVLQELNDMYEKNGLDIEYLRKHSNRTYKLYLDYTSISDLPLFDM